MNLKTLTAFIALAEELHFGRAAQRCGISQPAISRLLSELEADIGVKLLHRTSREVSLTSAGRGFLDSARKAVAYADMAVRAAQAGAVDGIDSLTVGMVIGTEQPLVGKLIAEFKRAHPETRVALRRIDERDIGAALTDGHIDVAIAWDVAIPAGLHHRSLGKVPLAVMVQSGHELEKKEPVTWADLAGYPIILPDRDRQPIIYDHYKRYTAEAGFEPQIAVDVSTMADALAMVAGGVGVGNAPVVPGLRYPGVSILRQEPLFEFSYELVWAHAIPAVESLLNLC
ncbi:LysR family transcriptional regulator [Nodosilinea sp. LEGE 06152]|uniref:LysR family transcriptional regulator n=1 Tax=Nodosilinea sp. LEGE 06152 TaxID=2777966 RepID=UPI001880F6D7|nr:LysR family transcriptional regulator [Nodosilinea sp. LEGE 06152]MBE9157542.1 LysR family transcriptional regulator [Nodosilinea sp. LEGE 06152]